MLRAVPWILALAVTAAGAALHARIGPPDTYWTIDNGGKALVLRAALAGRATLDYPGRDADPGFAFYPLPLAGAETYAKRRGGDVLSQYQSPFVWMTVPFAAAFGFAGLAAWPALGGGACVLLAAAFARRRTGSHASGVLAATLTAIASPLLFYSSVFWEHAAAGALAGGGLLLIDDDARPRPWRAGALLAGACLLREEMALLLAAAVLALAMGRRVRAAAATAIAGGAGIAALSLFHRVTSGSWTGIHLGVNRPVPFAHFVDAARGLFLDAGFAPLPWLLPAAALAAWLVARRRPRLDRYASPAAALLLGAVAAAAYAVYPGGDDRALALTRSNSALVFVPWILVAFAWGDRRLRRADLALGLFVLLFLALVPERTITGVHPGPRLLLFPLVPLAAAALAEGIAAAPRASLALAPLALVAILWNVRALDLLHDKRALAGRIAAAIRARPEPVVATGLFWLPAELPSLWAEKRFHLAGDDRAARALVARLTARGERALLVVDRPGSLQGDPVATVRGDGLPAFSVDLGVVTLNPPREAP